MKILPWFGGDLLTVIPLEGTGKVAYSWTVPSGVSFQESGNRLRTIQDLLIWHDCDKHLWRGDPEKIQEKIDEYMGWHPAGVSAHSLITAEPLHIEPSLLWPDCCGMHGWIRDGRWTNA